jgi:hypothetical protein
MGHDQDDFPNRSVPFPESYDAALAALLARHGLTLHDSPKLAAAVMKLSDHYLSRPSDGPTPQTPWHQPWAAVAYAVYFFPLNYLRVRAVVEEAVRRGFLSGLSELVDFGAGLGTVALALADAAPGTFSRGEAIERADGPRLLYDALAGRASPRLDLAWSKDKARAKTDGNASRRLHSFSFALTELPSPPPWTEDAEALMLIEPATHQDGRRLLALRQGLLSRGFHAWAPCTHQGACPLFAESERDWCHDRITWTPPDWWRAMAKHLPMRNATLAMSYLLMRRTPPPSEPAATAGAQLARLTGDAQRFKGVTRQMICRGAAREFLAWQHRDGEPPALPRGLRVELAPSVLVKGRELRPKADELTVR